jgi:ribosomal-protein-alanine N-acetyltransferase
MAVDAQRARLHVEVVPMKRRHLRSVVRIEQQVYPRPWSLSLFLSELALSGTRAYLVARVGRTIVGYGGVMFAAGDAHITTLAVDPTVQRHGIATRVLVVLTRKALDVGADALTLEVRASNTSAQALYRRFGFSAAGVRKGYYADNGEDAIVMWANDIRGDEYRALLDSLLLRVPGTTTIGSKDRRA